jgi:Ca-activated chloride channel family protein
VGLLSTVVVSTRGGRGLGPGVTNSDPRASVLAYHAEEGRPPGELNDQTLGMIDAKELKVAGGGGGVRFSVPATSGPPPAPAAAPAREADPAREIARAETGGTAGGRYRSVVEPTNGRPPSVQGWVAVADEPIADLDGAMAGKDEKVQLGAVVGDRLAQRRVPQQAARPSTREALGSQAATPADAAKPESEVVINEVHANEGVTAGGGLVLSQTMQDRNGKQISALKRRADDHPDRSNEYKEGAQSQPPEAAGAEPDFEAPLLAADESRLAKKPSELRDLEKAKDEATPQITELHQEVKLKTDAWFKFPDEADFVRPQDGREVAFFIKLPELQASEARLRAYHYYRALDAGLTFDDFTARKLEAPPPSLGDEGLGVEGFRALYGVSPFVDTRRDYFSTFGMDVDTASYTLARKALSEGRLPDPAQVRVEEFINYFREDVPPLKDEVFSVHSEGGPAPFGDGLDLLKITIKARDLLPGERKDAVLTFAIDTSGSMHRGDRLQLVRESLAVLVRALGPDDRVAIVAFNDHPYLVLPHTTARDANRILGAIDSLSPRGDTNFEAGLDLAYRIADEVFDTRAIHRVVLCSDGVATAGARGPEEILKKVEVFAKRGIYLSCVGFGMGKYNDRLLETLADKGNGNYAYVDGAAAAAEVFRNNLPSTLQVLAADAKIQVEFTPEVVSHYRLLGYENRDIADRDFRNDAVDAGEVGPGSTVTVLYEVLRRAGSSGEIGRLRVRYRDTGTGRVEERDYPLAPGVIATSLAATSDRFRFIAGAAEMAELLRGSYWARNGSYGRVLSALESLNPEYRARPEWRELTALAARAQEITIRNLEGH